jgi:hypothetical protein
MHLDWLAVDSNSNIRLICEVKTTVTRRNAFGLNGVSPDVLNRAQARAIPLHLAVVRLKQKPPESISTVDGARAYEAWLRDHPNEFSVEIYDESQFTIRGMGISLVS